MTYVNVTVIMLWNLYGICIHVTCSIIVSYTMASKKQPIRIQQLKVVVLYILMVLNTTFPPYVALTVLSMLFSMTCMVQNSFRCNAFSWYMYTMEDPTRHLICIFLVYSHTCTRLNGHAYTEESDSSDLPWYTT